MKKAVIHFNEGKPAAVAAAKKVAAGAKKAGIEIVDAARAGEASVVFVIGGDGTMLESVVYAVAAFIDLV